MNLAKLQYITDSPLLAREACELGVKWIQARIKNKTLYETRIIAKEILGVCKHFGAVCIVNDYLEIALEIEADGSHLGTEDLKIEEAKKIIGSRKFIIGGSSNTINEVIYLSQQQVTYIGLGPFRFTSTKQKLSPMLGCDGYKKIISELKNRNISFPPIYAIGGILVNDIQALYKTGINGLAISGAFTNSTNKKQLIEEIHAKIYNSKINTK